ncbi:hypothetical protein AGRA3207_007781 [Actinomadura graeca]|uniref:Uncharacterized protein n=1 Tax=Actinomadura graeca TaxID=2750812 RepID=A0ABX8R512_9ACTN|nr:hypothetical protein [Actinomadura graeca]QXJ26166.1 hypothetical protein AGRA3207_007781 [Actinomadura graeca]
MVFVTAGALDGPLLTATLRLRADHAPPGTRSRVFAVGAGLEITAATSGTALAGAAAGLPAPVLLLAVAASHAVAGLLHPVLRGTARSPAALSEATSASRRVQ